MYKYLLFTILFASLAQAVEVSKREPHPCIAALTQVSTLYSADLAALSIDGLIPDFNHYQGVRRHLLATITPERIVRSVWTMRSAFIPIGNLSSDAFLALFEEGSVYNFVIFNGKLVFTQFGDGFLGDLGSKHSVLSGLHSVFFAGRIWRQGASLVIDNESGTYRSSERLLAEAAALIQTSIQVKVHFLSR